MGSLERDELSDDDGRAFVDKYPQNPKYAVWDEIMLVISGLDGTETLEGPYFIETVIPPDRYTLSDDKGNSAKGGMVIREKQLKARGNS